MSGYSMAFRVEADQRALRALYMERRALVFRQAYFESIGQPLRAFAPNLETYQSLYPETRTTPRRKRPSLLARLRKLTTRAALTAYHFFFTAPSWSKPMTQANLTVTYTDTNGTEKVELIPLDRTQSQAYTAATQMADPNEPIEVSVSFE